VGYSVDFVEGVGEVGYARPHGATVQGMGYGFATVDFSGTGQRQCK
jgi:hypothetical protein